MTERRLRTCSVCRSEYRYCNQCKEDADKPTWYFTFCSENCHDIYKAMSDFENGNISDEDAKEQLNKLDLSKKSKFGESYKNTLKKIMVVKPVKNIKKNDEQEIVNKANIDNEMESTNSKIDKEV